MSHNIFVNKRIRSNTHSHTHFNTLLTNLYIYIYIYIYITEAFKTPTIFHISVILKKKKKKKHHKPDTQKNKTETNKKCKLCLSLSQWSAIPIFFLSPLPARWFAIPMFFLSPLPAPPQSAP